MGSKKRIENYGQKTTREETILGNWA